MAAALRTETATSTDTTVTAVDRQQWWADVQFGVSAMLTEAARPASSSQRLAG